MIWIYRILFLPLFILLTPYSLWLTKRRGGLDKDLMQKFGGLPNPSRKKSGKTRIWIQAVSVGEVSALKSLLQKIAMEPTLEVILTTTTNTGYQVAKRTYRDLAREIYYFPLDFAYFNYRAWKKIEPDICILTEGELWPEHLHRAKKKNVPVILINARMSDKSLRYYRSIKWISRRLFSTLNLVIATSEANGMRFRQFGIPTERIKISGNLKCDASMPELLSTEEKSRLSTELGLPDRNNGTNPRFIVCGASTWPGEELVLLQICKELREEGIHLHLLITPRHMERRNEIREDLTQFEFSFHFRSSGPAPGKVDVAIGDSTGELSNFIQLSDIVFVGKSLHPHTQGQTPIEAGMLKKPVLFGPGMSNFRDIARSLRKSGVAEKVENAIALKSAIQRLCQDKNPDNITGCKAEEWLKENQGATDRTMDAIMTLINKSTVLMSRES